MHQRMTGYDAAILSLHQKSKLGVRICLEPTKVGLAKYSETDVVVRPS